MGYSDNAYGIIDDDGYSSETGLVTKRRRTPRKLTIAVEEKLRKYIYSLAPSDLSYDKKTEWLLDYRRSGNLGYLNNKDEYDEILSGTSITAYNSDIGRWWTSRLNNILQKKCTPRAGTVRPVGSDLCCSGSDSRENDRNQHGLHKVFGLHTHRILKDIDKMTNGEEVPHVFCKWDEAAAKEVA